MGANVVPAVACSCDCRKPGCGCPMEVALEFVTVWDLDHWEMPPAEKAVLDGDVEAPETTVCDWCFEGCYEGLWHGPSGLDWDVDWAEVD